MANQAFSLIPFPDSMLPDIQIGGHVSRQNGRLNIQYTLTGATDNIFLPQKAISPQRKDGLWAATCFEFFLAIPNNPQYWELNLSPSGDWNIYHMDDYRRVGFREEASIQQLPFAMKNEAGNVTLHADVDLSSLISANQPLQLGIACVIQSLDQHESYWALVHTDSKPDFHLRESFIILL